jgi:hypothetical protein
MNTFFRLAMRERRLQFLYLLVAISVLTLLVSWIAFRNQDYSRTEANYLSEQIRGKEQMLKRQLTNLPLLDSAYRAIVAYRPEVNAIFVEVDIEEHLNEVRRLSAPQADGTRFRAFAQIADFYKMMYVDKKVVWSKQSNIGLFQKQLDDCSVGMFPGAAPGASAASAAPTSTPRIH